MSVSALNRSTGRRAHSPTAIEARAQCDLHLSVLPLSLLLETITAICVPILVGARTHFASALVHDFGAGSPADMCGAFERRQPTTTVSWCLSSSLAGLPSSKPRACAAQKAALCRSRRRPVSETLAARAWELGIPAHEGYGLTECCSVVAVNRPGRRKAGTVGEPLPGLDVRIEEGEVVVSGPTVMAGYLHARRAAAEPWRTGDLGSVDSDGYLRVTGRKDNLLITSSGRNISPEWIEGMIAGDARIGACAVLSHGQPHLSALLVPSRHRRALADGDAPRPHPAMARADLH